MKITGCCLPYGESKYHDTVQVGAFSHQNGEKVPLLRSFGRLHDPSNVIGHCTLHDTETGVMCDIYILIQNILKEKTYKVCVLTII